MRKMEREINRDLVIGWGIIVAVLFAAYLGEVAKGERELAYCFVFMAVTGVPAFICGVLYRRNPVDKMLRYWIVAGYFIMYLFVMCTGSTFLVFVYILPLLSFLILYHQPGLIAMTGAVALMVNGAFIISKILKNEMTVQGSKDDEIRMALLILCFLGSYLASRLYDRINSQNEIYVEEINEKSRQIQEMTFQTIETIANTIDAKDEYTKGHSRRVSDYSAIIAEKMGMDKDEIMKIRYIALLHDIGKIGVPDSVLNKPGRLTDYEYGLMKEHTLIGGRILQDIGIFEDLDFGAKFHHERYDGKGYPDGLKGEEIPKIARIIGVADAFDAMTSNRVYRKHLTKEQVLEELKKCRGSQFDPEAVDAFLKYLEGLTEWNLGEEPEDNLTEDASGRLLRKIIDDQNRQAKKEKEQDELTGVYNRSAGERKVVAAMQDTYGCLALINLDNMRKINCESGYRQGDEYIKVVSKLLGEMVTDIILSRFGGDEFMCFLPGVTDQKKIEGIFEDFRKEIRHVKERDERLKFLGASVGITVYDKMGKEFSDLLLEADKALYFVKHQNKSGFYFYKSEEDGEVSERPKMDENQLMEMCNALVRRDGTAGASKVILFTAKPKDEFGITVEEREEAMRIIDYVIAGAIEDENMMKRYSSVQRAVILTGDEEEMEEMTDAVTRNFYKVYDKKNVELYYDVMDVGQWGFD